MLTGSVSAAARLINVTQPAVSRILAHAELQLGFPLFHRGKGAVELTAEEVFDRRWAATVLESAYADLESEFRQSGQLDRFAELKPFLSEDATDAAYDALSVRLGIKPKAVSSAVCRLRDRYAELVRQTVLATVAGPEEIDPEFRELFR